MRKAWKVAAALAGVAAVPDAGAWAACEPFTAYSSADAREVSYSDVDADGAVSAGDKRFGRVSVMDADGNKIGVSYLVATIREVDAEGAPGARSLDVIYVFDDGVLFLSHDVISNPFNNFNDGKVRPKPDTSLTSTIVGGLDAYAGARGTSVYEPAGMDSKFTFNLTCE
jgi:hypothetical protein